jgi:hypothetical protein
MLAAAQSAKTTNERTDRADQCCRGVMEEWSGGQRLQQALGGVHHVHWLCAFVLFLGQRGSRTPAWLIQKHRRCTESVLRCLCKALEMRDGPREGSRAQQSCWHWDLPTSKLRPFLRPIIDLARCSNTSQFLYSTERTIHHPSLVQLISLPQTGRRLFT